MHFRKSAVTIGLSLVFFFSFILMEGAWAQQGCQLCPEPLPFRGDANNDCVYDIADPVFILMNLFAGGAPYCNQEAYYEPADTNGDDRVDISDVVRLLEYLFLQGPPPVNFCPNVAVAFPNWQTTMGDPADTFDETSFGVEVMYDQKGCTPQAYLFVGKTNAQTVLGAYDHHLVWLSLDGTFVWEQILASSENDDQLLAVDQTFDVVTGESTGFVIAGLFNQTGKQFITTSDRRSYLGKISDMGTFDWGQELLMPVASNHSQVNAVQQTEDGGYITAGHFVDGVASSFNTTVHAFVIKTDAEGNKLWERGFLEENTQSNLKSIRPTRDGGYIASGVFGNVLAAVFMDSWVIKLDENGATQWEVQEGTSGPDFWTDVWPTNDGGYVVTGWRDDPASPTTIKADLHLVKFNSEGEEVWETIHEGVQSNRDQFTPHSVRETSDGGLAVGGYLTYGVTETTNQQDGYLGKFDSNGNFLWERLYTMPNATGNNFFGMELLPEGGFVLGGETKLPGNETFDHYMIKTDAEGLIGP